MDSVNTVETLKELNDEEVIRHIPLILYLSILCISGIAGNSLVCYIFAKKNTVSTYHIFVTILSIVDLFTCCITIPTNFILQFWQYTFDSTWICKLTLLLTTWTSITSDILLLCIAFNRYRKVCTPFSWQISLRVAKRICIASAAIGLACSGISPIINGIQKRKHGVYNITISRCGITQNMKETLFPLINNILFLIYFLGILIGITGFYCLIALRVRKQMKWKHRTKGGIEIRGKEMKMTPAPDIAVEKKTEEAYGQECDRPLSNDTLDPVPTNKVKGEKQETLEMGKDGHVEKKQILSQNLYSPRSSSNRMSLIMFTVSLIFIISYLPVISLLLVRSLNKTFEVSLNDLDRSVYNFFLRSYFLNSVINPVIYGILDPKFRKSCKLLCSCRS